MNSTHLIYNIVVVANEGYAQHAAVMLCSLFETNKSKKFNIYLFTDGIGHDSFVKLNNLCEKSNSKLIVKQPELELGKSLGIDLTYLHVGQWNTIMYYKLFIPIILPKSCCRCLFLDVDMVINDDIGSLYNWELKDSVIAAAEDIPDCIKIKKRLGLDQSDNYINSGVMVCNLVAWRKMEEEESIFDFIKMYSDVIINDQDVIALYFRHKLSLLPIRWNMTTFYFMRRPKIFDKYLFELGESKRNPGIIHFAAPIKPWFRDCIHPYQKLYKKYLKLSAWRPYNFRYYEKLSLLDRIKYIIRWKLNSINILKDPFYLSV